MGFPRQEYKSWLPFPSPGDLPDPGTEPASPVLQADSFPLSHLGSPEKNLHLVLLLGEWQSPLQERDLFLAPVPQGHRKQKKRKLPEGRQVRAWVCVREKEPQLGCEAVARPPRPPASSSRGAVGGSTRPPGVCTRNSCASRQKPGHGIRDRAPASEGASVAEGPALL